MEVCDPVLALGAADTDLVRPMLAIAFVLGLLFLLLYLVRRIAARGSNPLLRRLDWRALPLFAWRRQSPPEAAGEFAILGQLTLTPTHRLHVLSLRGRDVAIVTHPQGCEWFALANLEARQFSGVLEEARAAAMRSGR